MCKIIYTDIASKRENEQIPKDKRQFIKMPLVVVVASGKGVRGGGGEGG